MTDIRKMFADLTCAIEDLHSIAVEGQAPDLTSDSQRCLLAATNAALNSMSNLVRRMIDAASDVQP